MPHSTHPCHTAPTHATQQPPPGKRRLLEELAQGAEEEEEDVDEDFVAAPDGGFIASPSKAGPSDAGPSEPGPASSEEEEEEMAAGVGGPLPSAPEHRFAPEIELETAPLSPPASPPEDNAPAAASAYIQQRMTAGMGVFTPPGSALSSLLTPPGSRLESRVQQTPPGSRPGSRIQQSRIVAGMGRGAVVATAVPPEESRGSTRY